MTKKIIFGKIGKDSICIGDTIIPLVIAEVGVLTWGEFERGKLFVDEAKKAGIKLLKFQAFNADNVVSKDDSFWYTRLKQRELSKEVFFKIRNYAKEQGLIAFATTHNEYDLIDFSKSGMEVLKIGSGDSNNFRMIDMALSTGKPVIVSLGLLSEKETYSFLDRYKSKADQLIIMHCVTLYPAPPASIGLDIIDKWKEKFPQYIYGYSDHSIGSVVSLAATARGGVSIIEKHLCLDEDRIKPKYESLDIVVAMTPSEMSKFICDIEVVYEAIHGNKKVEIKKNSSWARKSIVAKSSIKKGSIITHEMLVSRRPYRPEKGDISIEFIDKIVGKFARRDINENTFLKSEDVFSTRKRNL